jgi:hypothetical protein
MSRFGIVVGVVGLLVGLCFRTTFAQQTPITKTVEERIAALEKDVASLQKELKMFVEAATGKPSSNYPQKNAQDLERWIKSVDRRLDTIEKGQKK